VMGNKTPRRVPEERAATPDEIQGAVSALSKTDWYRLGKFADYQIFLLAEKAGDRRGGDLLNEAFRRLLQQSRNWDRTKVGFMGFLFGAMESIANSWLRKKESPTEAPALASSLITENADGELSDPAEEFQSTAADGVQMLVYRETIAQISALFSDDQEVQMVIEGLRDGLDPRAIRELWGFSQKQYNAIVVRMRRHLEKAGITDPTRERRHVQ
jgi:hypothetical protein